MKSTEQIQELIEKKHGKFAADESFVRLERLYREKSEQGAVIRNEYSLPELDTIGRELYREFARSRDSYSVFPEDSRTD